VHANGPAELDCLDIHADLLSVFNWRQRLQPLTDRLATGFRSEEDRLDSLDTRSRGQGFQYPPRLVYHIRYIRTANNDVRCFSSRVRAGLGHAPFWEAPGDFNPVLERFLQDIETGRAASRPV
jgi:hypothetical protein